VDLRREPPSSAVATGGFTTTPATGVARSRDPSSRAARRLRPRSPSATKCVVHARPPSTADGSTEASVGRTEGSSRLAAHARVSGVTGRSAATNWATTAPCPSNSACRPARRHTR
jgi:hypothetical protein